MRKTIDQKTLLDRRFTSLSVLGQHLWMTLQIHPKTNALGVCDWTFRKISAYSRGGTPEMLERAGRELESEGLLVIDADNEEALLTNHIDLTADSGTVESAYLGTASPRLREILVRELDDLRRQGKRFPFTWDEISGILAESDDRIPGGPAVPDKETDYGSADMQDSSGVYVPIPTVEPETVPAVRPETCTAKTVEEPDENPTSSKTAEPEEQSGKKRRSRPRKHPLPPEGEDKPKRRRGRPRKYRPEPVELADGTMEPSFGEPMTMEQVKLLPQYDSAAPIDIDDDGGPMYVQWDEIPQQLWFWHPLPEDWTPTAEAAQLYKDLGGGSKTTVEGAADMFRRLYDSRLYTERDNGFKAAPLPPDRLFVQQLLHWRREKDEENARKAKEEADMKAIQTDEGEPMVEADPVWGQSDEYDTIDVEPEDEQPEEATPPTPEEEAPKVRHYKRMVPKDWKPNQKHIDRAEKLNIDIDTEAEKFYNYSHSNGKKYLDFDRAFDNWLLNADKFNRNRQNTVRKTRSEEGYEHNMSMLEEALAQAGWDA